MIRFIVFCFAAVITLVFALSAVAQGEGEFRVPGGLESLTDRFEPLPPGMTEDDEGYLTNNPNSTGWRQNPRGRIESVEWEGVSTKCLPCEDLVDAYNHTMGELMNVRFEIRESVERERNATEAAGAKEGAGEAQRLGAILEIGDKFAKLRDVLEPQERQLTAMAQRLREMIAECEKQCKGTGTKTSGVLGTPRLEGAPPRSADVPAVDGLPFNWQGPYPSVCFKCEKLAERLNELDDLARSWQVRKAIMQGVLDRRDAQIDTTGLTDATGAGAGFPYKNRDTREWAENNIKEADKWLEAITRNFADTLKLYEDCVKTCQPDQRTGMVDPDKGDDTALALGGDYSKDIKGCTVGYQPSYTIGANSEYGTGAQTRNKIEGAAKGAAMNAIGGLLGGGGLSLGGGRGNDGIGSPGGGSSSTGPKTYKDPLKMDFTHLQFNDLDIGVRAGFTDDGFTVSQKIFDSPGGDSTFHAMWLENGQGRKMLPVKYYIYSLYQDHKLTFWWTYDHWTNGVHDDHDEGRETQEWRTNLGDLRVRFAGDEGVKNSIWYQSGFETAVKGVRQMGAVFPVTPGDLTGCGVTLVSHVTMPKQEPVTTIPILGRLFINKGPEQRERDLLVHITPVIAATDSME